MSDVYDPRAIANLILDEAERRDIRITNLALQKLLYFAHGIYLTKTKRPLVSGYFEAWRHGPVHPAVYRAFKKNGSSPISFRAMKQDPLTGQRRELSKPIDMFVLDVVSDVIRFYGPMSPARLVDLSHAKDSPWSIIVDKARTNIAFGMRIPDKLILERFRHHKVSLNTDSRAGELPSEDAPIT